MPSVFHEPILRWKAVRSGDSMTITGQHVDGSECKQTNVVSIDRREDGTWATDKDKNEFLLS